MAGAFSRHAATRDLMELLMHERNQPLESRFIALAPGEKESGDLRWLFRNAAILALFSRVQPLTDFSRFKD
jgi:hypothetical protein